MVDLRILSETEIETYSTPDTKLKRRVITYQAEGFAPRTIWLDADKLPDVVWQKANQAKPIPADVQVKGDILRRKAAEADLDTIKTAPQPRKI